MNHFYRRLADGRSRYSALTLAIAATLASPGAYADEKSELQALRATTSALIDALVSQGLLSREKADALIKQAQASAQASRPASSGNTWGAPLASGAAAGGAAAGVANTVRVPYVSETLRQQIREEIKNDVLLVAREERWADARVVPEWVRGVSVDGDVRVRWQNERFAAPVYAQDPSTGAAIGVPCLNVGGNLPAECYRTQRESPAWSPDLNNTTIDRNRMTLRARLGVNAKVSDQMTAGLRLSTGTTTGPTSSSQTLGTGFNKASLVLDRAFLRWEPRYNMRFMAGRMSNPFYGTDLLWPDDMGFDGVAAQGDLDIASGVFGFATLGAFPLEEFNTDKRDKWLFGFQAGIDMSIGNSTQFRGALAAYQFQNVEGERATELPLGPNNPRTATQSYLSSQYPTSMRQKGNTLINLCPLASEGNSTALAPCTNGGPVWGLASKFVPINVTAGVVFKQWDPMELGLTFDWVKNSAFDLADIRKRAGTAAVEKLAEQTTGLQLRATLGMPRLANTGDWTVFAALRKFERDSWVDGFTDTTWHLGGTSYKGFQLGGSYAFDRRSTLGFRLTSTRNLDDGVRIPIDPAVPNAVTGTLSSATLKIDVFQIDLNTRF
ncbi:putative porin [Roseateles sp.]|uniref:putative porin n=1 Tax=Roseateles sp. TaxID=1971397 RepID=UPI003BA67F31